MSTRPVSHPNSSESLRLQMERNIDELAELARGDTEPGRFFAELLRRALQPGGAIHVVLWRKSFEAVWEPISEMPPATPLDADAIAARQPLLNEVAGDSQPRIVPQSVAQSHVFSPLRHSGDAVGILETLHPLPASSGLSPVTFQFFSALCEIAADFLSQQELRQLRRARAMWQQWDQYQFRLGQSLDLGLICATIANDGRIILDCDRITVLVRHGLRYRVQSISGVDKPDPRAGGVQSVEILVNQLPYSNRPVWCEFSPDGTGDLDPAVERHCRESGANCVGILHVRWPGDDSGPPRAILLFETFHADESWSDRKLRAESLVQRSSQPLRAAIERSEIPWLDAWQRLRQRDRMRRPGMWMAVAALTVITLSLLFIPAEFTVSGHAELWPELRRDVFATTSGVVDQVLVNHGDQVQPDQPLVILRDPELEQDVPKIAGEIATARERLRGIQLARLTGTPTAETLLRNRQLATDEEELKERLKTLDRQHSLVEERRKRLTLRSPIAGRVLTWDTMQHLSARPVEKGQALITIGETGGPWIVEVLVADKDVGPLLHAIKRQGDGLKVEFQLPSEPGRTYAGRVRDVSLASESDDRSAGHVRVLVEFDRGQIEQLRPGATAVPRIHCGRYSLGYVWLHDLIDAIRLRVLF